MRPFVAGSTRSLRYGASCAAIFGSLLAPSSDARAESSTPADPGISSSQIPQRIVSTHPLNVKRQLQEFGLQVSAIETRLTSRRDRTANGLDIVVGIGLAPKLPVLRVSGYRGLILRAFDAKSFSLTPFFQGLEGGAHLGIFEVSASASVSALSVDVAHGDWSFGLFQPRVSAFAGLKLRELHVRAAVFSEFYWRWFGEDNAFVRGIGLQLVIGTPNTAL